MVTTRVSQIALSFGVDDLEGTIVLEKITHTAGADTPIGLDIEAIVSLIRDAGKVPVERDSLYNTVGETAAA
jgi:aminodeoxyfutalosine synthase